MLLENGSYARVLEKPAGVGHSQVIRGMPAAWGHRDYGSPLRCVHFQVSPTIIITTESPVMVLILLRASHFI